MESAEVQTVLSGASLTPALEAMLPIHFFTIVLNGMPFIREHLAQFAQLKVPWHWHIVEGVAELKHDTAWSVRAGGRIPENFHRDGLSIDGTAEYLDQLRSSHCGQVSIYRKAGGAFWEGKREMVGAPLKNLPGECLLWEVDVDEFWSADSIYRIHKAFEENPDKTAAWYWCNFHVASDLVVCTRNCYSQNPQQEWLRTWRYQSGDTWARHEPPVLVRGAGEHAGTDVAKINAFDQNATESFGAVFNHLAYVRKEQLVFKESYYGYHRALENWERLQTDARNSQRPLRLSDYFSWVKDTTYVKKTHAFSPSRDGQARKEENTPQKPPMTLVDGVVFQDEFNPGIARVWTSILRAWASSGFAQYVSVLDRGGSCPDIPGINRIPFPKRSIETRGLDSKLLQEACSQHLAEVFVSTNYTAPIETPSVCLVHDFIPEKLGCSTAGPDWQEKGFAIHHASALVCVSKNTADDLEELHPHTRNRAVKWAHLGVSEEIIRKGESEVEVWKKANGIIKPFFLFVGERFGLLGDQGRGRGYKNASSFFRAFRDLDLGQTHQIVLFGGSRVLEKELAELAGLSSVLVRGSDEELASAYSGALCLVYPSKYEGFGLPVAEAISCGCPVITSNVASLPEVAGSYAVYVDPASDESMARAITQVLGTTSQHASADTDAWRTPRRFDWSKFAATVQEALCEAAQTDVEQPEVWLDLRQRQAKCEARAFGYQTKKLRRILASPGELKVALKRRVKEWFNV